MLERPRIAVVETDLIVPPCVAGMNSQPLHSLHGPQRLRFSKAQETFCKVSSLRGQEGRYGVDAPSEVKLVRIKEAFMLAHRAGDFEGLSDGDTLPHLGGIEFSDFLSGLFPAQKRLLIAGVETFMPNQS